MSDLPYESREAKRRRSRVSPADGEYLSSAAGGWYVVGAPRTRHEFEGDRRCGMTGHRGVLSPDEWDVLDDGAVDAVVRRLGFTRATVLDVCSRGPKSSAQRELRGRVDARLLSLAEGGGDMAALARVVGLERSEIHRAVQRARVARNRPAAEDQTRARLKVRLARKRAEVAALEAQLQ